MGMQGAGECLGGGGVHTETSTKQNPAAEGRGGPRLKSMDMTLAGEPSELGSSGYLLGPGVNLLATYLPYFSCVNSSLFISKERTWRAPATGVVTRSLGNLLA